MTKWPGVARSLVPRRSERGPRAGHFRLVCGLSMLLVSAIGACGQRASHESPAPTLVVAPLYPPAAFALPHGGDVRIEVTVEPDGTVTSAKPIAGSLLIYDASLKAAKRWHFRPSREARKVMVTFSFRPLAPNASIEDATAFFMPPYHVEVRKKMPPSTVNVGY